MFVRTSCRVRAAARPLVRAAACAALLLGVCAGAAPLAACGGSSAGGVLSATPSGSSSSGPAAGLGSTPLAGTPKQAVAAFWRLVDADDYTTLAAATAPGSAALVTAQNDDIERVELLDVARVERGPGSALVQVDVRVVPAGPSTPWGDTGRHTLFVRLVEQAPDEWLVSGWGTSP
jgi:hypothetical protein